MLEPAVTENSVVSENKEVPIIREIIVASSLFVALFGFGGVQFSNPCGPAGGDPRASAPTCGFPKECAASLAPPPLRPTVPTENPTRGECL